MKEWERQERHVAKATGGKRNAGSGSGWLHPNDIRQEDFLWECKQTDGKSISIKLDDWEKLRKNAYLSGRRPGMHLQIGRRRLLVIEETDG